MIENALKMTLGSFYAIALPFRGAELCFRLYLLLENSLVKHVFLIGTNAKKEQTTTTDLACKVRSKVHDLLVKPVL